MLFAVDTNNALTRAVVATCVTQGASVTVNGAHEPYTSSFVEVVGRAEPDGSVTQFLVSPWGDSFDLKIYDKAIQLAK